MPLTAIYTVPHFDSFTTLADHQSQTPETFYDAKPILHFHGVDIRALAASSQMSKLSIFSSPSGAQPERTEDEDEKPEVVTVDAFIASDILTLFNHTTSTGISIPYPTITLHAIKRLSDPSDPSQQVQGLYMQLELSDPYANTEDDEEPDIVELTLIPSPSSSPLSSEIETESTAQSTIQSLFSAISDCSNLHPGLTNEDEDMEDVEGDSRIVFEGSVGYEGLSGLPGVSRAASDGGLPPAFPGSRGWITAENVGEYFDEGGNWIGGGEVGSLGEGAGRVRGREEIDGEAVNGHEEQEDDSKRVRTE